MQWRGAYISDASVHPPMRACVRACARPSEIIVNATPSTPLLGIFETLPECLAQCRVVH